jgi:hypothetical protein
MSMQKKLLCDRALVSSVLLVTLGILSISSPAQAGFKWVPPQSSSSSETVAPAPVASDDSWMPAPQIIENKTPAPVMGVLTPPKDIKPQGDLTPVDGEVVQGFANNVPLSVALRQVLPPKYGFSVSPDINMNHPVSWKGGAPWRVVMKAMLAPQGLEIKEQGELIHVVRADKTESTSMALGALAPTALSTTQVLPNVPPSSAMANPIMTPTTPAPMASKPVLSAAEAQALPPISMVPEKPKAEPVALAPVAAPSTGYLLPPSGAQMEVVHTPFDVSAQRIVGAPIELWTANKGTMLKDVLDTWGRKANVEISWQAEYDYPLQATVSLTGSFEEAVRKLLEGFQEAQPQPIGYLYNNQAAGQTVLVVQVRGNNYTE